MSSATSDQASHGRLDAFLAHRGFGSRSEVRTLIRSGRVRVGLATCRDPARHLHGDTVSVSGVPVAVGAASATLLCHKPAGLACSHDAAEAPLLYDLIPPQFAHLALEAAGRLDRATTGLLILSSDGQLVHALTNPRRALWKRYRIHYTGRLSAHAIERCVRGIDLPPLRAGEREPPTRPARLTLHGLDAAAPNLALATLELCEGRFHQVRRMIAALGGEVVALHRDRIGGLDLPEDLAAGVLRLLTEGERTRLLSNHEDPLLTQA